MYRVKNWSSHQSYKDRKPPWIRFHKSMLDNYEFHIMSVEARAILPMLWLLASEDKDPTSGLIRDSFKKMAFRLRQTEKQIEKAFLECVEAGFIEQVIEKQGCFYSVHDELHGSIQPVTPETETETETETDVVFDKKLAFDEFWSLYSRKDGKKACNDKYSTIVKTESKHKEVIKGVKGYMAKCQKDNTARNYIKLPLTFLNGEHWQDESNNVLKEDNTKYTKSFDELKQEAELWK